MDMASFAVAVQPLVAELKDLPLADPERARAELERRAPADGELVRAIREAAFAGMREGWLVPHERGGVRFGRVAKDLDGVSVDAVLSSGPGPRHLHPRGEVDLLWAVEGTPRFDGHEPGWAVYAPGSSHVPGVEGGTMLILYFLPGGEIEWQ